MDINRLLRDELSYELNIRNLPIDNTVADMRVLLRNAIRCEKSGYPPEYPSVRLDADREIEICSKKIDELTQDIENFNFENKLNEHKRIHSRLLHLNNRINRITAGSDKQEVVKELFSRCLFLLDKLTILVEENPNTEGGQQVHHPETSILDEPNPVLPSVSNNENVPADLIDLGQGNQVSEGVQPSSETELSQNFRHLTMEPSAHHSQQIQSSPAQNTHRFNTTFRNWNSGHHQDVASVPQYIFVENREKFVNLSSWNISFNGESGSIMEFLQRIEEFRKSRGVTKEQLFRAAPELLRGTALNWFRSQDISSWDSLVEKLKDTFLPHDYEFALNEEIRKRSQGPNEKVIVFISSMQNLMNKLKNKPDEATRITLIRRNLLPYLQNAIALHTVTSVDSLIQICRTVEDTTIRSQQYCPPSTNSRALLEPQLGYKRVSHSQLSEIRTSDVSNALNTPSGISNAKKYRSCWNCGSVNHTFRACTLPYKIFCFKCGNSGVTVKNCSSCSGNVVKGPRRIDE